MFLLNNIHDRNYKEVYNGLHPLNNKIVFDINDFQLKSKKNEDWLKIKSGNIVCVIKSSRKISTFYRIALKEVTNLDEGEKGFEHVIVGDVIAKLETPQDMTTLLNKFGIRHKYLNENKFSNGFNVVDLGSDLDELIVISNKGITKLGDLEI